MAEFSRLVITGKGQALLAKMIVEGYTVGFTRVSSCSTEYTDAQMEELTELSDIRQTSQISKVTRTNETAIKVEAAFTNTGLTEGYYMRALGLYAEDPDAGEILYAVTREVSGNCYMPAYNGVTVSGAYVQLVTAVGNAENVTLEVDSGAYATMGDIKTLEAKISELSGQLGGAGASGDTGFAEGIEADNVVDAINEVFQSGNEKKEKLVENLVAMGIEASTDETWESLLNKVLDMTDTSGDTVTADTLLSGYTAHNATGEQITGVMPDRRATTVTAAAVTQDDDYTYLDLPEGEACYSGGSKVRALNSDLTYKLFIPEIRLQTYGPSGTPNNSTRFILPVGIFTKMTIGKMLGSVCIYPCKAEKLSGGGAPFAPDGSEIALGSAEQLTPTNGVYDLSNVDAVCFYISLGQYNSGASLDVDWQDRGSWAKCALEDIFLY